MVLKGIWTITSGLAPLTRASWTDGALSALSTQCRFEIVCRPLPIWLVSLHPLVSLNWLHSATGLDPWKYPSTSKRGRDVVPIDNINEKKKLIFEKDIHK